MIADVEVRIVLPGGMGEPEGWEHHLLPIAREEVQPRVERPDEGLQGQPPLVDHAPAHVHGLGGLLGVEEGGVDGGETAD